MQTLTLDGQQQLRNIAQRYGVSAEAAHTLLEAVMRGSGSMAQFNHPELGGYGQWMRGGMTMVGDMFNHGLKATVDGLCNELSRLLDTAPFEPIQQNQPSAALGSQTFHASSSWWPAELGQPSSSGGQNNMRYAYFPGPRRLVIDLDGAISVYDTLDHQIGGVSQQQGNGYSLSLSSQYGYVDLRQLPLISTNATQQQNYNTDYVPNSIPPTYSEAPRFAPHESEQDVFAKLERLGALKQQGVITEAEFAAKKAELLARI